MKALIVAARRFATDEEGITAIEYGLLAAVIVGVVAVAFTALGKNIETAFGGVGKAINDALPKATPTT